MEIQNTTFYKNLDIKIKLGNLLIDIIYIHFVKPSPTWKVRNHSHSSYELHYIPYGSGTFIANNKKYILEPGIFYLTGPGIFHEQFSDSNNPMAECCINFDYKLLSSIESHDYVLQPEITELISLLKNNNFWFGEDKFNNLVLFERLQFELEHRHIGYFSSIQNYISQIIINSLRCLSTQKASYTAPIKTLDDYRRGILDDFFAFRYQDITISEMSKSIGVSERQLDRILYGYYKLSFTGKLLEIRMKNALHLLNTTKLSVEEISISLGYNSASYFCRAFKQYIGVPPSKYNKDRNNTIFL